MSEVQERSKPAGVRSAEPAPVRLHPRIAELNIQHQAQVVQSIDQRGTSQLYDALEDGDRPEAELAGGGCGLGGRGPASGRPRSSVGRGRS